MFTSIESLVKKKKLVEPSVCLRPYTRVYSVDSELKYC